MTASHGPSRKRGAKELFSRFYAANPEMLHAAAHSHHPWPDVSYDAQQRAWLDAVAGVDRKWSRVFEELFPAARRRVADVLSLPDPATLCFGASVHQFLVSVISSLDGFGRRALNVVTTDAEFHSASRQLTRFAEEELVHVDVVPAQPFDTFPDRFSERLGANGSADGHDDLVFLSQVQFDSGYELPDLAGIVDVVPGHVPIMIDGYHGFMAVPTDLSDIAGRAFYCSGGYKYAMAGENACFLHAPDGWLPRPVVTGWWGGFGVLSNAPVGEVVYDPGGSRFMGATFDPVGVYRLEAVLSMLDGEGWSVAAIHDHVRQLQQQFLDRIDGDVAGSLLPPRNFARGNFLTFVTPQAGDVFAALAERDVVVDYRRDRLRIGFGIYHDEADVERLAAIVSGVWAQVSGEP
ncbi:MAG: aminotransferase class V-fold PLP-dependent enzyme [Actinomycetota bacterium]|nr:aminotransferase class V-fold PLP-dependent enzyme [Actinomycetota bacterium]